MGLLIGGEYHGQLGQRKTSNSTPQLHMLIGVPLAGVWRKGQAAWRSLNVVEIFCAVKICDPTVWDSR